ncbi:MAG: 6-phosphogluconolactonase [Dermatophilaceae bacterium]
MAANAPEPLVLVHPTADLLAHAGAARLLLEIQDAQTRRGVAHLVLTGGGMGSATLGAAATDPLLALVDWSRVHLWWGDERFLPTGHPDRNETQNRAALLDGLPLDPGKVHAMLGPDRASDPRESAQRYAAELAAAAPSGAATPAFDVVLLGVGPDAHVCSLFPGHPQLAITDSPTSGVDESPKPPPQRVTLTYPALAAARHTWFLVAGRDKADAVALTLSGADPQLAPAAVPRGSVSTLWLLDVAAADRLAAPTG